jgi:putative addiction module component (TIGR02574 family)
VGLKEFEPMAQPVPIPPPGFDDLSVEQKLDYVQSLWDRIAATPTEIPVPDWHREVLEARRAAYRADPQEGKP